MMLISFPGTPPHFPGYKSASHPFRQLPLEQEPILCNQAEKMAIPHPRWVFTALSLSWLELKYFIAFMLFRLKPAGLVFRRPLPPGLWQHLSSRRQMSCEVSDKALDPTGWLAEHLLEH